MSHVFHAKQRVQVRFSLSRLYTASESRRMWQHGSTNVVILAILILLLPSFIAQAAQQNLLILKGTYTGGEVEKDVTAILQKMAHDGQLQLEVQNDQLGGDPKFGEVKTLTVTYRDAKGDYSISAREGERLTLPNPNATSLASETSGSTSFAERRIEPELRKSSADETKTNDEPDPKHLSAEGILFLTERVSLVTDSGVTALAPGTRVEKTGEADGKIMVKAGVQEFEVEPEKLTNDLSLAEAQLAAERAAYRKARAQAAAIERAEGEKRAKQQKASQTAIRFSGRVLQIVDEGLLIHQLSFSTPGVRPGMSIILLSGHPNQNAKVDNDAVDVIAYEDETFSYTGVNGAARRIKRYQAVRTFQ